MDTQPTDSKRPPISALAKPFLSLSAYYTLSVGLSALLLWKIPFVGIALEAERGRTARGNELVGVSEVFHGVTGDTIFDSVLIVAMFTSLVGTLVYTLPIAMTYQWTHRKKRYSKSTTQTLLLLPVAVASVVFLIKESLALAFGVAGVVAAVRFRNTLEETRDAVYFMAAVSIGLSAGAQLLTVSAITSSFFCYVALAVWAVDFGDRTDAEEPNNLSQT